MICVLWNAHGLVAKMEAMIGKEVTLVVHITCTLYNHQWERVTCTIQNFRHVMSCINFSKYSTI